MRGLGRDLGLSGGGASEEPLPVEGRSPRRDETEATSSATGWVGLEGPATGSFSLEEGVGRTTWEDVAKPGWWLFPEVEAGATGGGLPEEVASFPRVGMMLVARVGTIGIAVPVVATVMPRFGTMLVPPVRTIGAPRAGVMAMPRGEDCAPFSLL